MLLSYIIPLEFEALAENDSSRGDVIAPPFRLKALRGDRRGQGLCIWIGLGGERTTNGHD